MDKIELFYVFACLTVVLAIGNIFLAQFIKSRNLQFIGLKDNNVKTTGKITRLLNDRGRTILYYEFNAATGETQKGSQVVAGTKEYAVGDSVDIIYSPDKPSASSISELFESKLAKAKTAVKVFTFLPLQSLVMFAVLWFFLIHNNIVQLPF